MLLGLQWLPETRSTTISAAFANRIVAKWLACYGDADGCERVRVHHGKQIGSALHRSDEPACAPNRRASTKAGGGIHVEVQRESIGVLGEAWRYSEGDCEGERDQRLVAGEASSFDRIAESEMD